MINTFTNVFIFVVTTVIYFFLAKPKLSVEALYSEDAYKTYSKSAQLMLAIYFITIILMQFFINSISIVQQCGGSVAQNMGIAAMATFLPWFFFMGLVMVCLLLFPGWKSAFSDVIGYFAVSSSANKLLSELLVDSKIRPQMENLGNEGGSAETSPSYDSMPQQPQQNMQMNAVPPDQQMGMSGGGRKEMEEAASAIVKMVGNMSIMINQITPDNFVKWWEILKPLMKEKYQQMPEDSGALYDMKKKLLSLVVTRDNIGEAMWYIYTAILLMSIVSLNIATKGCIKDATQMQADADNVIQTSQENTDKTNSVKYKAT